MPLSLRLSFAAVIVAVLVGGPWWYHSRRTRARRNFHVVREGVLYRSGQLNLDGLRRLVHDHGIRTIVNLRDGEQSEDRAEEEWARKNDVVFVRIPPRRWWASDGTVPAEKGLAAFRAVLDDPARQPVLVHCYAGIHRTGAYCAVYRMDYEGWSNDEALAEMQLLGYGPNEEEVEDVLTYLGRYRPVSARAGSLRALPVARPKTPAP